MQLSRRRRDFLTSPSSRGTTGCMCCTRSNLSFTPITIRFSAITSTSRSTAVSCYNHRDHDYHDYSGVSPPFALHHYYCVHIHSHLTSLSLSLSLSVVDFVCRYDPPADYSPPKSLRARKKKKNRMSPKSPRAGGMAGGAGKMYNNNGPSALNV